PILAAGKYRLSCVLLSVENTNVVGTAVLKLPSIRFRFWPLAVVRSTQNIACSPSTKYSPPPTPAPLPVPPFQPSMRPLPSPCPPHGPRGANPYCDATLLFRSPGSAWNF